MVLLNTPEHLLHISIRKMNQNWSSMGTVVRILTETELVEKMTGRLLVQRVIRLNGPLTAHHNSQFSPVLMDRDFLGQQQHITHLIDPSLNLFFLEPNRMFPQNKLVVPVIGQVDTDLP